MRFNVALLCTFAAVGVHTEVNAVKVAATILPLSTANHEDLMQAAQV